MKIYTSFYDNLKYLPEDVVPISIAGEAKDWYKGDEYKKLAPKLWFFKQWKKTLDNDFYIEHFKEEVLDVLDVKKVIEDLMKISGGKDIVLLCHETPGKFCHRHLVAKWLMENGYDVIELENLNYGG
jgi:NTP pyrophosphatase (non-canonical NTP hydrolase)